MEGEPLDDDPSPLQAFKAHTLLNPLPLSPPFTTHLFHRSPSINKPSERLSQLSFASSLRAPQSFSAELPLCNDWRNFSHPGKLLPCNGELQESDENKQEYFSEDVEVKDKGAISQHGGCNSTSGKEERFQDEMYGQEHASATCTNESSRAGQASVGGSAESPGESVAEGSPKDFASGALLDVSGEKGSRMDSAGDLDGESENENSNSSGNDVVHDLSLHENQKGEVCPLRALSHIAHIKRKQDCREADFEHMPDARGLENHMHELSAHTACGSPSQKKKFKQVQFQLESLTYQKLRRLLAEQHQGSFQRFVMAALNSIVVQDKMERKTAPITRKAAFSRWKRTRFDQLKGIEMQELALAFRSLAEALPNVEVSSELIHTPWQELNMSQIQKMLEETKKMLHVSEKIHDCPYTDCGRRFSSPGSLKDHLNEHSGEQPYTCSFDDCPHRFRSKQHLCRHMKKHERAHTCTFDGCNKRFAFRERLIVHQKIHSDERPLSCPWEGCGKTFKWANSLHGHMRTHTGEKPFQCTFAGCGRLFGYKVDLTRHRRTHFGQPARASH